MKQSLKNETDMLGLMNKIQAQLMGIDKKLDSLMNQSLLHAKQALITTPIPREKERVMHTAICADCKKECTIPFKPSGDRPVYCQDCFSRRKVISLSKITVHERPKEALLVTTVINKPIEIQKPPVHKKKKVVVVKKPIGKKKPVPKKK